MCSIPRSSACYGAEEATLQGVAREHFEHEIHGVFVLAEEWIEDEELERMANWNVDHTFEEMGRPAPWKERA